MLLVGVLSILGSSARAAAGEPEGAAPEAPAALERDPASTIPAAVYGAPASQAEPPDSSRDDYGERTVVVKTRDDEPENEDRSTSVVTRKQFARRLPRSSPDALRYEPGVFIQQTAHGQGSPYIRGHTGQQVAFLFDGVRMNNSLYRQGPNQYVFTVDVRTIERYEIVRGPASTRYGSDAVGGAIVATPVRPSMVEGERAVEVHPRALLRHSGADQEYGGRAQFDLSYKGTLGFFGGFGYRDVGQLRSGGRIIAPETGEPWNFSLHHNDGGAQWPEPKMQHGTGFREFAWDSRVEWAVNEDLSLSLNYYDYRQFDVPRADKCPAPTAPRNECYVFDEQFRTLVYAALDSVRGPAFAETARARLSFQRAHERWRVDTDYPFNGQLAPPGLKRPFDNTGRDDVNTAGAMLELRTKRFRLTDDVGVQAHYGADGYLDFVESKAWQRFFDTGQVVERSRGQHLPGNYFTGGAWTQLRFDIHERLLLRGGGRFAHAAARAEGDPESNSLDVDARWSSFVGETGVHVKAQEWLTFDLGANQGFRAPNLSDLTARRPTGPGFQVENAELKPERSTSFEVGVRVAHERISLTAHAFHTRTRDVIQRGVLPCDELGGCSGQQFALKPVNLRGPSINQGADGLLHLRFGYGFALRSTVSYVWTEGPDSLAPLVIDDDLRTPLSKTPPLNGSNELMWSVPDIDVTLGGGVRWAALQDRLSPQDLEDFRIPLGGTPGFVAVDLWASYQLWKPFVLLSLVLENLGDAPYRYHGSSINGPGRSLNVMLEIGY